MAYRIAFEITFDWADGYDRPHRQVRGVHPSLAFETEETAQAAIDALFDADDRTYEDWYQPVMDHVRVVYGEDYDCDNRAVSAIGVTWRPVDADDPAVGLAEVAASLRAVAAEYVAKAADMESRL